MKRALLIGINYIGTKHELGGCINDINNIEKFIIDNCDCTKSVYATTASRRLHDIYEIFSLIVNNYVSTK